MRGLMRGLAAVLGLLALAAAACAQVGGHAQDDARAQEDPVVVSSKTFTESVVLGELATQSLRHEQIEAVHRKELGGSRVLFEALKRGDIDVYAEYTGTLAEELFGGDRRLLDPRQRKRILAESGLGVSAPLGFDNTYALGMREERAAELGISRISDLVKHPQLVLGFSNEFMERGDGWPSLRDAYRLPQKDVQGLDHDLAYRGIAAGSLDVIDLYATDAEIDYYGLRTLEDDLRHFPEYRAVFLFRLDRARQLPRMRDALQRLAGEIPPSEMIAMNQRAKLERVPAARVAAEWLRAEFEFVDRSVTESRWQLLWRRTLEHLWMVCIALAAAIVISVPIGVLAYRKPGLGQLLLGAVGILQTIPALALLVLMVPVLGIGVGSAVFALFLYSLLPIVRNTHAGLVAIPADLHESAAALGLSPRYRLLRIELPLALPSILAGIKTSAVICVGTATLGALIGAGGLGQPILTGIRLDDHGLILLGALPAAILAVLAQASFELVERHLVSPGLR
jgi:osmoprotectant transport system permease protein